MKTSKIIRGVKAYREGLRYREGYIDATNMAIHIVRTSGKRDQALAALLIKLEKPGEWKNSSTYQALRPTAISK